MKSFPRYLALMLALTSPLSMVACEDDEEETDDVTDAVDETTDDVTDAVDEAGQSTAGTLD